jgi:hypothetical protein
MHDEPEARINRPDANPANTLSSDFVLLREQVDGMDQVLKISNGGSKAVAESTRDRAGARSML